MRAVRKLMRSGPVTQAEVATKLNIHQGIASALLRSLIEAKQVKVSHKERDSLGRRAVTVYELTQSYLSTVKPNEPEDELITHAYAVDYAPRPPSRLRRFFNWLIGRNAVAA